ncbi:5021_t:CDS:2, partial [Funneliformis mosseae]
MDYKVPTHAEIDDYFSTNPVSEWHLLNVYMNTKLESSPLLTASELFRSFCRSLTFIEKNENYSYPKYVTEYAKKLRMAMKTMRDQVSKSKALDEITNAIIGNVKETVMNDDEIGISKNGKIDPM